MIKNGLTKTSQKHFVRRGLKIKAKKCILNKFKKIIMIWKNNNKKSKNKKKLKLVATQINWQIELIVKQMSRP